MPPTSNSIYTGMKRRRASDSLIQYKETAKIYHWEHNLKLKEARRVIREWPGPIRIDRVYCFHLNEIIWKTKKTIRKNDVTNRIKVLDDSISEILQVDDSAIFWGSEAKVIVDERYDACVQIKITPTTIKKIQDPRKDFSALLAGQVTESKWETSKCLLIGSTDTRCV